MRKLLDIPHFHRKKQKLSGLTTRENLERMFEERLNTLCSGHEELTYGNGRWLELMRGKKVFPTVAQTCFAVKDRNGKMLQGPVKAEQVVKSLAKLPLEDQPHDFQELHRLIDERLRSR